jgi:cytochrome c oxidase assembly protein subunit 11
MLMFGFGFALVPLYDTLCRVLGINGKVQETAASTDASGVGVGTLAREVAVQFVVNRNRGLAWDFEPTIDQMSVRVGEPTTVAFRARNNSGRTMTIRATPNVTPGLAASFLRKTECFCFASQTLPAGESVTFQLVFFVDSALPERFRTLTLSYSLFEIDAEGTASAASSMGT